MRNLIRHSLILIPLAVAVSGCGDAPKDDPRSGSALVINEVSAGGTGMDWFELYNGSGAAARLDDYQFTDNLETRGNISGFPDGASIAAGRYHVVQFGAEYPGFGLKGDEELGLIGPDDEFVDTVDWEEGDSPIGGSYARVPDGAGSFQTTTSPTPGSKNAP